MPQNLALGKNAGNKPSVLGSRSIVVRQADKILTNRFMISIWSKCYFDKLEK